MVMIVGIVLLCGLIVLILCIATIATGQRIQREDEQEITATVTDRRYESSYVTMITINTCPVPQSYPERYLVTTSYEDVSGPVRTTFNDRKLYETVKKGDTVQMILYKAYDKEGNLVGEPELRFPK